MADNILERESPQTAKRMRLDSDHAGPAAQGACSSPPCPLGGANVALQEQEEDSPSVRLTPYDSCRTATISKLLEGLNRLRLQGVLCDVVLCCEGQEVSCHRAVLAAFSPYFEAMFTSGMKESTQDRVTISGLEPQMIAVLVNYAYTHERLSFCADNVQALLAASDLLEITAVREACCKYMEDIKCWENREASGLTVTPPPKNYNHYDPHHPNRLLEGLNRLRLDRVLCDVVLCCDGQEVSCHRSVLASFSPYFEAMFTSGMRESTQDRVTISGLEPQMIAVLVNYAYTGEVSTTKAHMQALLAASVMFDVAAVRELCSDHMVRHVDVNNCVEMYFFAEAHSCEELQTLSMQYIEEHFSVIYQQEAFLSLSVDRLTEVLSSDHLNVPEEDMVFEAAMLWLDQCPSRKQNFGQVLENIRLPLISPSYLHTVAESLDVVKEQQGCQRFISEAKGEQPCSDTARPRRTTVMVVVGERWKGKGVDTFESFDPLTKEWRTVGDLPVRTDSPAIVVSGSTLYLAGGTERPGHFSGDDSSEMWRYDAHSEKWTKMASMKEGRGFFSLVTLDGYVFAVGGWGNGYECPIERYDPSTDTWEVIEEEEEEEEEGVGAHYDVGSCDVIALDGHLYFIGGAPGDEGETGGQVAKFNPVTSAWTQLAPMKIPRNNSAACVLNGKIYVTGGLSRNEEVDKVIEGTVERYDPQSDRWTMCASFKGRYKHSALVDNGQIYVLGGTERLDIYSGEYDESRLAENIECYCEETDTWEEVGEMPESRFFIRCVSLKLPRYHGYHFEFGDDDDPAQYSSDDSIMNDY